MPWNKMKLNKIKLITGYRCLASIVRQLLNIAAYLLSVLNDFHIPPSAQAVHQTVYLLLVASLRPAYLAVMWVNGTHSFSSRVNAKLWCKARRLFTPGVCSNYLIQQLSLSASKPFCNLFIFLIHKFWNYPFANSRDCLRFYFVLFLCLPFLWVSHSKLFEKLLLLSLGSLQTTYWVNGLVSFSEPV